jgi:hypothetical protein
MPHITPIQANKYELWPRTLPTGRQVAQIDTNLKKLKHMATDYTDFNRLEKVIKNIH